MEISVVIPVFNEASNLAELHSRLSGNLNSIAGSYDIIYINDGSTDNSLETIRSFATEDPHVKYLDLSRNFGQQIAISAGIDHAGGKYVIIMDADLQDPPELIPALYNKIREGFDVVCARRKRRRGESVLKKTTAKTFYRFLRGITSVDIPVDTGDFRIMRQKVAKILRKMPEQSKFIRGQIAWAGFRQAFVEYDREERRGGKSAYSYRKMMRFAKDGITSFSDLPLKLVTWSGFVVALVAFVVGIYSLYSKLVLGGAVPGWTSIMISLLFLGGVQLISIGIIGEYISRIGANVRNRPLYIINHSNISGAEGDDNAKEEKEWKAKPHD